MRALILSCFGVVALCATIHGAEEYDFRTSAAYKALEPEEREKLEQVHRDFVLLWGAIDMYHEDRGQVPEDLSDLVPCYLKELPRDPFATTATAKEKPVRSYKHSLGGLGYQYCPGDGGGFLICSTGLPKFPYRPGQGLYVAKGFWTGGGQLVR